MILLKVMTSHRKSMMIKSCWELANIALSFCVDPYLCNRARELYIIKISFELRACLSCYDLEGIIERTKRNKKIIY